METALDGPAGWLLLAAAIATASATIWRLVVRPSAAIALEVRELLRDLRGYPGRPGHPPRPGLLVQVLELDAKVEEHLAWSRDFVEEYLGQAKAESTQLLATIEAVHGAPRDSTTRSRVGDRTTTTED